jgi:YidC/Oxa1 family membrane protein insertase
MSDQKNMILAIVLSALVLLGWQYFIGMPQFDKQKQAAQNQPHATDTTKPGTTSAPTPTPAPDAGAMACPAAGEAGVLTREAALAKSPRVRIDTPAVTGSIALTGARIDDVALVRYRETVDPKSPPVVLLSPCASPHPYYAEAGWFAQEGIKVPDADTVWRQEGSGDLGINKPVTLVWSNGAGLEFRRTISIDDKYLFSIKDEVANKSQAAIAVKPYGLISRHGTPKTLGYWILHEGLIGVLGADGVQTWTYDKMEKQGRKEYPNVTRAWLGITDEYWAAALIPNNDVRLNALFSAETKGSVKVYQTAYTLDSLTIQPNGTASAEARLFAGAKEVATLNAYEKNLSLDRFSLLIDWGWFWFITQPMFALLDYFFHLVGNFGIAILIVTVLVKIAFFPLANKSYASMAKMKALQPQMQALRERYGDDKVKQQQELMELYKKEKINPIAGCLPMLIQVPVFFSLYKVLLMTIEMRHAPFFGWIKDLSAHDPTNVFNLFGLLPYDPATIPVIGHFLPVLGVWPLVMGFTMWMQMKLNPAPPDPTQKMIFDWMPVIFTFMLANFSSGLVIYWAWNNTLSVIQQSVIMHKNGAKIELWDNLKATFVKPKPRA